MSDHTPEDWGKGVPGPLTANERQILLEAAAPDFLETFRLIAEGIHICDECEGTGLEEGDNACRTCGGVGELCDATAYIGDIRAAIAKAERKELEDGKKA